MGTLRLCESLDQLIIGITRCDPEATLHLGHFEAVNTLLERLAHAFLIGEVQGHSVVAEFFGELHHKAALAGRGRTADEPCLVGGGVAEWLTPFLTPRQGLVGLGKNLFRTICSLGHCYF
ncbi:MULTISPECIES: hypothetical protein [Muribaculaceae]|uniref:hypothetical protein n=1 Tax=uncultured Duncaniella sp. TaxID=2768039 RepID=UPI0025A0C1EB|nr:MULTISPECIES: hypothetical protein [Muribaculaceae]